MYPFEHTALENQKGRFDEMKSYFNQQGFDVGGNWEEDHGFFDKKLKDNPGYLFLRIPVYMVRGHFGEDESIVRLGKPFLLRHKYQIGLDDNVQTDVLLDPAMNQFQEPVDRDASLKQEEVEEGRRLLQKIEQDFQARH